MATAKPSQLKLSFVVPVYNESAGLNYFHKSLTKVIKENNWSAEIIYVDDGSLDDSAKQIQKLAANDKTVSPLYLSKNFGKESATTAGLHHATGQAVFILDADSQHPVELLPQFVKRWQAGAEVVVGVRVANQKEGAVKRYGSRLFYRLLRLLGVRNVQPGSTDFRLIDRQVVDSFKKLTEHNRVTRALIDWLGYQQEALPFVAHAREHGEATYSNRKLVQLALNGFVSLSFTPLYFSGYAGILITLLSFGVSIFAVVEKYVLGDPLGLNLSGAAILGVLIVFLVGVLLIGQGLLAVYVARIYTEVQNRPLYLLRDTPPNLKR